MDGFTACFGRGAPKETKLGLQIVNSALVSILANLDKGCLSPENTLSTKLLDVIIRQRLPLRIGLKPGKIPHKQRQLNRE